MPTITNNRPLIAFILLCFFWGTTYMGIRIGIEYMPPYFLSSIRHIMAGLIFIAIFLAKGHKLPNIKTVLHLTVIGFFMIVCGNGLLCWAEQYISSGLTAIISAISPIFVTILSIIFFKDFKITFKIVLGLLIGFGGVVLISYNNLGESGNKEMVLKGTLFLLLANLCWGIGSIIIKKYPVQGVNMYLGIGIQMLSGGLINMLISLVLEHPTGLGNMDMRGILAMLYLVIFGSLVGYTAYFYVMQHFTPARISFYSYINTLVAVILGWLFLNEHLDSRVLLGMFIVLGGVILVNQEYVKMAKK